MGRPLLHPIPNTVTMMVVAAVVILTMTGRAATTRAANDAETVDQIGDYDRPYVWRYGDAGFDAHSARLTIDELTSKSPEARGA
jgi:hypothetical protein